MKLQHWCVSTLVLALSACASSKNPAGTATGDTSKAAKVAKAPVPEPQIKGDYQKMVETLNFTPEQLAVFKTQLQARNEKNDAWHKSPTGVKFAELRKQMDAAKRANDEAKAAALKTEMAPLTKAYTDMRADVRKQFIAGGALTLAQQKQWAGQQVNKAVMERLAQTGLSAEQTPKIKDICDKAAADAVKSSTYKSDPYLKAPSAVEKAMERITKTVLTPEQKGKILPPKAKTV